MLIGFYINNKNRRQTFKVQHTAHGSSISSLQSSRTASCEHTKAIWFCFKAQMVTTSLHNQWKTQLVWVVLC